MSSRPGGARTVRARVLAHPPFLWSWVIEDPGGQTREQSWQNHWSAFGTMDEALRAGRTRLDELARSSPDTTTALRATAPCALVIVKRDEAALGWSLLVTGDPGHLARDHAGCEEDHAFATA